MGNADRIIRVILAVIIGYLYYTGTLSGTIGFILMILAWVFVITSLIGFCPLYKPLGINTCSKK